LPPELRKKFGKDEVGYDYLGNAAIGDQDPHPQQALHTLMKALDQDPEMKEAVLASLSAMTGRQLAAFARKTAHYRAEDLVRNALRETSDRELRSRAREVLHWLRRIPTRGPTFPMH